MTKAWDVQDLLGRVKAKALPIAALVAGDIIDWSAQSLQMSENTVVKVIGGVIGATKQPIMDEINKGIAKVQADAQVMAAVQPQDIPAQV